MADTTGTKVRDDRLYLVTVTEERTATFWVIAPNEAAARDDAAVLAEQQDDEGWDEVETDFTLAHAPRIQRRPASVEPIWSGGPDGTWIFDV